MEISIRIFMGSCLFLFLFLMKILVFIAILLSHWKSKLQNHRITERLSLEGTYRDVQSELLAPSELICSRLLWSVSDWVWNIFQHGDSTMPLCNLCHLHCRKTYLCLHKLQLMLTASPGTGLHWEQSGSVLLISHLPWGICTHWSDPPEPSILQAEQPHPSQPFLIDMWSMSSSLLASSKFMNELFPICLANSLLEHSEKQRFLWLFNKCYSKTSLWPKALVRTYHRHK